MHVDQCYAICGHYQTSMTLRVQWPHTGGHFSHKSFSEQVQLTPSSLMEEIAMGSTLRTARLPGAGRPGCWATHLDGEVARPGRWSFFPIACLSLDRERWFFSFQLQVCLSLSLSVSVSLCCNIANSFVVVFSHKHRSAQFHYLPWDFLKIKLQTEYMLCDW